MDENGWKHVKFYVSSRRRDARKRPAAKMPRDIRDSNREPSPEPVSRSKKRKVNEPTRLSLESIILEHALTLELPPDSLLEREKQLESEVAAIKEGRCYIRQRRDLERELQQIRDEIHSYSSGSKKREYLTLAQPYLQLFLKVQSDNQAVSELERSLARLTEQEFTTTPFRKRSKLERSVQMARSDQEFTHGTLTDEFMASVHGCAPPVYINQFDICPECDKILKRESENTLICEECGATILTQESSIQTSSRPEAETQTNKVQYKQEQHCRDKLKMISVVKVPCDISATVVAVQQATLGKIPTEIGPSLRIIREHIQIVNKKHAKYAIPIWCAVTGNPVPVVSAEEKNVLCAMFTEFATEFSKVIKDLKETENIDRKNMLSYPYVIHKFCIKKKYYHLAPFFSVQKCDNNLVRIEYLYEKTSRRLKWEFVPYDLEPDCAKGDLCAICPKIRSFD